MERQDTIDEFRNTLDNLRGRGVNVKKDLIKIGNTLDKECIAPLTDLKTWSDNLTAWLQFSIDCHKLYKELFNKQLPDKISAVEAALDAEERKISDAITVSQAEKFLLLSTADYDLTDILRDYQSRLKKLLANKKRDDKFKAAVEPYALFMETLQEIDFGKRFFLSDGLRKFFNPDLVGKGIFANRLTFGDFESPVTAPPKVETPPPPDFASLLEAQNVFLTEEDFSKWRERFNVKKVEVAKPFSANNFRRDLGSDKPDKLKKVLSYIASFGFLALPGFCPTSIPPELLHNVLQLLITKGYIQKYAFEGRTPIYGLTKKFSDFLRKDDGKKFFKISITERFDAENSGFLAEDVKCVVARVAFCRLSKMEDYQNHSLCGGEFFSQAFFAEFSGNGERDLIIGCFWDTAVESDNFFRKLRNLLRGGNEYERVFVTGLTFAQTEKFFRALNELLSYDFPEDAQNFLYEFEADAFYIQETGEPVSTDEIWDETEDDDYPSKDDDDDDYPPEDDDAPIEPPETPAPIEPVEPPDSVEDEKNTLSDVKALLLSEKFYCATAYLKALGSEADSLYKQTAFALNDPLLEERYSAAEVFALISADDKPFNRALIIAAALRAFFYNDTEFDYNIPVLYDEIKNFELLKENSALARLLSAIKDFKVDNQRGADCYAAEVAENRRAIAEFNKIAGDADAYYNQFFKGNFRGETGRTTAKTKQKLFDSNSEFGKIFELVKAPLENYSASSLNTVKKFLAERFIRKGASLDADNLDNEKLLAWVEDAWDEVKAKQNKNGMVGDRRNNVVSNLESAGAIMCAWVKCVENLTGDIQSRYEEIFSEMLDETEAAYTELGKNCRDKTLKAAGALVVCKTLKEISARLRGDRADSERKYFYVQFLCGEYVILDENYLPRLDFNISDGTDAGIAEQILKHAAARLPSVEERIEQIFQKYGDDFGSAKLLDDYLISTTGESFIRQRKYQLDSCISSAGKDAAPKLEEFKGGVELAQIHGQLYNMTDEFREKILETVENCYEYAKASGNYGVFFRVKKFWEDKIQRDAAEIAQVLKDDLLAAAEEFKNNVGNYDSDTLNESVEEIGKIISIGNLAAARTLIAELARGKLYRNSLDVDVTLSRFIDNYGECYSKVQNISTSLKNLLAKQSGDRNKFSKLRSELIESWIPNGMPDSVGGNEKIRERVWDLLTLLGFDVHSVDFSDVVDSKSLTFAVKLKKSFQMMHTHPIAAFGSEAEVGKAGFRVTCLFGQFPLENLIDNFKKLDAGNTLILLDYALKLPERRRLAAAMKSDRTLMHIFAVIDRVVIMYLLKNCSEQIKTKRITDTLMSLIMPFSRCQPYIWDPQKPLPPEMFIGRENEMFDVKNPDGVNIVYGGRQLGKSALLKMACREIDGNKNQRAIYVEIRNKDYRAAALAVSRELSDAKFFEEPFETYDWDDLTRAIKMRLSDNDAKEISYFLLTLDEADKFIETCAAVNYAPIDALSRIQQANYNGSRFKFVIAGLRNIVRFEKERSRSDNPILPVLKPLTIKPFAFEEARKLLAVPLQCLGLQFSDDRLIFTVAETALYFPGMIQLFCEKLLLTLFEPAGTRYGENAPPYEITESHIKKVLADEDFLQNIKDKIEITLRLGDDKYYYVIAQILAHLYCEDFKAEGYTATDVLNCAAKSFDLVKERYLPAEESKIDALMLELCDLNILRKTDSGKYLFARKRIFSYMGTRDEVELELLKLSEAAHG